MPGALTHAVWTGLPVGALTYALLHGSAGVPGSMASGVALAGGLAAALGATIPDVDWPGGNTPGPSGEGPCPGGPSFAARLLGPLTGFLAAVLYRLGGHRGPTHALLWPLLGFVAAGVVLTEAGRTSDPLQGLAGFFLGYVALGSLLHILQDATTPTGCPLYWPVEPWRRKRRLLPWGWVIEQRGWPFRWAKARTRVGGAPRPTPVTSPAPAPTLLPLETPAAPEPSAWRRWRETGVPWRLET